MSSETLQWAEVLGVTGAAAPPRSKGEAVYHALRRAILLNAVTAGAALLETGIAGAMNCSQGTVREALLRLEQEGLVSRRGYQGTFVSDTTPEEAAQMVRIRLALEVDGTRRAAARLGPAETTALEELVVRMGEAERQGDAYALAELDRAFHLTIFRAAGLPALEPILLRCMLHIHRHTFGLDKEPLQVDEPGFARGSVQHGTLLAAVTTGDPETAAAAMEAHIRAVVGRWSPEVDRRVRQFGTDLPPAAPS